jgi:hypothetical protein
MLFAAVHEYGFDSGRLLRRHCSAMDVGAVKGQSANVKKTLANSESSTHGTKPTYRDICYLSALGENVLQVYFDDQIEQY